MEDSSSLAKGVTDSAFLLDHDRKIIDFNRPFLKLHAVDARKTRTLKGEFCRNAVQMEICEAQCILKKALESGTTVRYDEVRGKNSSGEELNLIVTAIPFKNDAGEIVSVLEMHRDVTDEARIHSKYKVLLDKEKLAKEEAEKLVELRTRELRHTQSQLVHSEKMSALGQMVAGIAHELNNPINFVLGNLDVLKDYSATIVGAMDDIKKLTAQDAKFKEQIAKVFEQRDLDYILDDLSKVVVSVGKGGERAAEIVQGLKTFSRLDEAAVNETDLHQDIDMALTLLQHEYKNRVTVHKEYGNIPKVRCLASQMNQVFVNLLHNATQAVGAKGDIWIRTYTRDDKVIVEIEDNGSGIAPENLKKIFDPFFTTKKVGEGTGLGLSITYGIVERHGGNIEVESTVGKGTKFRVIVPLNFVFQQA